MDEISNGDLQIVHESSEEGYRITVSNTSDGALLFSWLMSREDAHRFATQIVNTLGFTT